MNGESGKKLSRIRVEKMCESRSAFCMTIANAYTRISKIIVCCVSMDGVFFGADSQRRKRKRNGTKRIFRGKKGMYKTESVHCTLTSKHESSAPKESTHNTNANMPIPMFLESPPCVYTQSASIYIKIYFSDFGIFHSHTIMS